MLGQPAEGVEERHPRLVSAAQGPLSWLLNLHYIAFRSSQVRSRPPSFNDPKHVRTDAPTCGAAGSLEEA